MENNLHQEVKIAIGTLLSSTIANTAKTLTVLSLLAKDTKDEKTATIIKTILEGLQDLLDRAAGITSHTPTPVPKPTYKASPKPTVSEVDFATLVIPPHTSAKATVALMESCGVTVVNCPWDEVEETQGTRTSHQSLEKMAEYAVPTLDEEAQEDFIRGLNTPTKPQATTTHPAVDAIGNFKAALEKAKPTLKMPEPECPLPPPDTAIDPITQVIIKDKGESVAELVKDYLRMIFSSDILESGAGPVGKEVIPVMQIQHDLISWSAYFDNLPKNAPPVLLTNDGDTLRAVMNISGRAFAVVENVPTLDSVFVQTPAGSVLYTLDANPTTVHDILKKFVSDHIQTQ